MYLVFLIACIAALCIASGRRGLGITTAILTTLTLAGLLLHHMTDKLPISL